MTRRQKHRKGTHETLAKDHRRLKLKHLAYCASLLLALGPALGNQSERLGANEACDGATEQTLNRMLAPTDGFVDIAQSVNGLPIKAARVGTAEGVVLWVGGIHGNERAGSVLSAELVTNPPALLASSRVSLVVIDDLNPDGTANNTRENANGVDLNRNFPAASFDTSDAAFGGTPLSQPESCVLYQLISLLRPVLTVVAHSQNAAPFGVEVDGPGDAFAEAFVEATPVPDEFQIIEIAEESTPGSFGQWWGTDGDNPVLTLEWSKTEDDPAEVASDFRLAAEALLSYVVETEQTSSSTGPPTQQATVDSSIISTQTADVSVSPTFPSVLNGDNSLATTSSLGPVESAAPPTTELTSQNKSGLDESGPSVVGRALILSAIALVSFAAAAAIAYRVSSRPK